MVQILPRVKESNIKHLFSNMSKHEFYKKQSIEKQLTIPNELLIIRMKKLLKFKNAKTPKPARKLKKQSYLKGLRFSIKGRLKGARRARTIINRHGSIGPNTYNKRSKSNQQVIFTK